MSANVEFNITAFDEASSVFNEVSESATQCFSKVETSAGYASDVVSTSSTKVSSAVEKTSVSFRNNALAANNLGTATMGLYQAFDNVENANIRLDKANLTVARSTQTLVDAQHVGDKAGRDLAAATVALEKAVEKDGENSVAAAEARQKLNDATQKYNDSIVKIKNDQDALTVAQERQNRPARVARPRRQRFNAQSASSSWRSRSAGCSRGCGRWCRRPWRPPPTCRPARARCRSRGRPRTGH